MSVSPGGHWILYSQADEDNTDIMLVDHFQKLAFAVWGETGLPVRRIMGHRVYLGYGGRSDVAGGGMRQAIYVAFVGTKFGS